MNKRSPSTANRELLLVASAAREQLSASVELLDRADSNLRRAGLLGAKTRAEEALVAARRALALVEITLKRIP